jgi:GNAT superfamily N-acetyltransferase
MSAASAAMRFHLSPATFEEIKSLRDLYREHLACQIVHDSAHYREGCTQSYLIHHADQVVGYGSIWTGDYWMKSGSVFEFYPLPAYQPRLFSLFEYFIRELAPACIYAQTNDPFLGTLIFDYTRDLLVEHILFSAGIGTAHIAPGTVFRPVQPEERETIFPHHVEPVGEWALESEGRIVATGGFANHYNPPYGDIFMEVDHDFRRRGFGRFLVQELKRVCSLSGRQPAARCRPANVASRKTLESAGFVPCGRIMSGKTHLPAKG